MKKIYLFLILLVGANMLSAQNRDAGLLYEDHVYVDNILTVKFHIPGLMTSFPIINLGASGALTLSFDDLDGGVKEYVYSVVHCNADWTPSDLSEMEYMEGFNEERFEQFDYSINTLTDYTHYQITLPNQNFRFNKSGNYILKVYEDESDQKLVISRRFMVVDPKFIVEADVRPASIVSKSKSHQEIDFRIKHEGIRVLNPRQTVKAVVLQNGRWDNALTNLKPRFIKGEVLIYEMLDKIVFPAGKEFRWVDLRTLQFRTEKVRAIEEYDDGYDLTLFTDKDRTFTFYHFFRDINGNFVIENFENDNNRGGLVLQGDEPADILAAKINQLRRQSAQDLRDNSLESDYANVLFTLAANDEFLDKEVYVFGAFSDWKAKPEFKMQYDARSATYYVDLFLKQGFYNYVYATVPKSGKKKIDWIDLEGSWFETENQYTVLVYYRPFGERYDHLVAAYTFDSLRN